MSHPVIIFHVGNQPYLRLAITQARRWGNRVILIGDDRDTDAQFVSSESMDEMPSLKEFRQSYRHLSPNNVPFERICIARWFYIAEVMKREQIGRAFVCDSDVMIYENLSKLIDEQFTEQPVYMTSTNTKYGLTAGQSIWSLEAIEDFTTWILRFYKSQSWESLQKQWDRYDNKSKLSGGISDMLLLALWMNERDHLDGFWPELSPLPIEQDLTRVFQRQAYEYACFFDNSIDITAPGWEAQPYENDTPNMGNEIKHVRWDRNTPFCFHQTHGPVKPVCLHFHGCKQLMERYRTSTASVVFFSRNDIHSRDASRIALALESMSRVVEEIVYVDWASEGEPLLTRSDVAELLSADTLAKVMMVVISPDEARELLPEEVRNAPNIMKHSHSIARNIGIRRARGDYIISTNMDIVFPLDGLHDIMRDDDGNGTMYTIHRKDVDSDFATALFDHSGVVVAQQVLGKYVERRNAEIDRNPVAYFRREALKQLRGGSALYEAHLEYSQIFNCGDFQMAHRSVWHDIRGFEELMYDGPMGTDSVVQKKCQRIVVLTEPHVFHLSHVQRNGGEANQMLYWLLDFNRTRNGRDWGAANRDVKTFGMKRVVSQ